ncbi:MAG TPA: helix-turn-helix domain-containing protein [Gaiellaceae bacterium]|nr:helix-turn-helix domain-containing protein [Gaiellaceae bacterium]
MRCNPCQPLPEEVARAADLLGRRWVLAILWASSEAGAVRFNEFKQALETIPPRTLAARLSELEEAGVLERTVVPDARPPRVEYRLTVTGDRLASVAAAVLAVPVAVLRRQHSR